ncbi:choice-of-anchor F family protein [Ferruginivarius sediminum]|uniref:Autotransporter outer membrane beta-barrel domain-containing protein n=1 Tax=Ferruginivarius sediminum TaxID=2661937 RepID=A0A369TFX1_9PROT|nr:choice-of-anchor F family protein [Ferruginivarius sediminum]RDD63712.1 autotransporter outer membrane beta-barrel domain-containing protein [Ferruginivarius sediminum]
MRRLSLIAAASSLAIALAAPASAGELLDLSAVEGDGFLLVDLDEGVSEPGLKIVTEDPNNDDFTTANQFSPQGVQNCVMSSVADDLVCDAPRGSGKRVKTNLTGKAPLDLVFNVGDSGGTTEYFNFQKLTNQTGARLVGFQVQLGTGTGGNFTPAEDGALAGKLSFDDLVMLTSAQATSWPGTTSATGQDPLQRAFFPGGLFGTGGADAPSGFFTDPQRAGFIFEQLSSDTLKAEDIFGAYATLFGNAQLSRNQVPDGLFFDDDGDPTTEAVLQFWKSGDQWLDSNGDPVSESQIQSLAAQEDYEIGPIEDLSNANVNFSFDVGDLGVDQVTLRFVPIFAPIVEASGSDYQFGVAASLDSTNIPFLDADPEFATIISEIESLPSRAAQQQALERAGTSYLRNFTELGFVVTRAQSEHVLQRLQQNRLRQFAGQGAASDQMAAYSGGYGASDRLGVAEVDPSRNRQLASAGSPDELAGMLARADAVDGYVRLNEKLTAYVTGSGTTGELDGTTNGAGADFNGFALSAGADYRLSEPVLVGAAVSYGATYSDIDDGRGELDVDGFTASIYGSLGAGSGAYLDGMLAYSWLSYDNSRTIRFGSIDRQADSDPDGRQIGGAVRAGYDFVFNDVVLGPSAKFQYLDVEVDDYTETGAGVLSMEVDENQESSQTLWIGGHASTPIDMGWGILRPDARLHWVSEFENGERAVTTNFTGGSLGFDTPVDGRDENYIRGGLTLTGEFDAGGTAMSVSLAYDGTFGNDDLSEHRGTLNVAAHF